MAIIKTNESYNYDNGRLNSNAGDWKDGILEFTQGSTVASTVGNICTHTTPLVGVDQFTFSNFDWAANGFSVGDVLNCTSALDERGEAFSSGSWTALVNSSQSITFNVTIAAINGNTITLTAPPVSSNPLYPFATTLTSPTLMPGGIRYVYSTPTTRLAYEYLNIVLRNTSRPDEVEFIFNLAPSGTTIINSIIDGEVNKFTLQNVGVLALSSPTLMVQSINQSGGYFKDVNLEKIANNVDFSTEYKITFKFFDWGIIEDGLSEPSYYNAANQLEPISRIETRTSTGGADILINSTASIDNTGGFNESFNGGVNPFITQSIQWKDGLGNNINGLNYSGISTFKAIIFTNGNQGVNNRYHVGLGWRPEDSTIYQNKPTNLGKNLLINAPENLYSLSGVPSGLTHFGNTNPSGARWDISEMQFTQVGLTLEVSGKVTANSQCGVLFSSIPNGGRKSTLWISLGSTPYFNGTSYDIPQADRISQILSNEDNIDAPILGIQIPDVVEEEMLDHAGNDITDSTSPNTTTEDDVLYKSAFLLPDNEIYQGFRSRISAYNTVTGNEFTLEENYIDFSGVVIQGGQYQPNITQSRSFNLPPTTDRNNFSLKRKPALDIAGKYGIEFDYGFLNDWRYWVSQSNVDNDFFSPNPNANPIPPFTPLVNNHDGKNKNWQEFYSGDWLLRISYFLDKNGVEDFNYNEFKIRPYEDDIDVTVVETIVQVSTGLTVTDFLDNEVHEVTTVFTWINNFTVYWVEFTIEDFEGGNRWVMSSILPQGSVSANPLKPIVGVNMIDIVAASNTLTCKALVDTNVVNSSKIALSYRVNDQFDIPKLTFQTNNNFESDGLFDPTIIKSGVVGSWNLGDGSPIQNTNSISYSNYPTSAIKSVSLVLDDVSLITQIDINLDQIYGSIDFSIYPNLVVYNLYSNPDLTSIINPFSTALVSSYKAYSCNLSGTLNLSTLTNIGNFIQVNNNPNLTAITNSSSTQNVTRYYAQFCNLSTLDLSWINSIALDIKFNNNPNLTTVINPTTSAPLTGYMGYSCNLSTLDFTGLTGFISDLRINHNPNLTTVTNPISTSAVVKYLANDCSIVFIDFTTLTSMTSVNASSIRLQNNGMSSTNVDQTFIDIDTNAVGGFTGRDIDLSGTNAVATATSLVARNSLIAKGFTLTYN